MRQRAIARNDVLIEANAETRPGRHLFANEVVEQGRAHPVMLSPDLFAKRTFGPIAVSDGQYFMMGDNRDNSFDSRFFGCVERKRIVGRATVVVISLDRSHFYLPRVSRFFSRLL